MRRIEQLMDVSEYDRGFLDAVEMSDSTDATLLAMRAVQAEARERKAIASANRYARRAMWMGGVAAMSWALLLCVVISWVLEKMAQ